MALSIETVIHVKRPAFRFPFSISPSGRWLAFTLPSARPEAAAVGVSSEVAGSSLWLVDFKNDKGFEIIAEPGRSSWSGSWSPVEDVLAFYCDLDGEAGLWQWRETSGIKRITRHIARPYFGFESPVWTPDGRYLVVKSMPSEQVDDSRFGFSPKHHACALEPISVYKTSGDGDASAVKPAETETWVSRYRAELVRIDSITAESQIVARGFHPLGVALSPDGTLLVFANAVGHAGYQQMTFDLWVAPVQAEAEASGQWRCVATNVYLEGPTFTWYDDNTIIYTTAGPLADGALWGVRADGKSAPRRIAFSEHVKFFRYLDPPFVLANGDVLLVSRGKLWRVHVKTGELASVIPDWDRYIAAVLPMETSMMSEQATPMVILQTREPKKEWNGFWLLDLSSGRKELLYEEPRKHYPWYMGGTALSKTKQSEKLIYAAESENEPPALYSLDLRTKQLHQIEALNPGIDPASLGTVRTIEWKLRERKLKGILLLPPGRKDEPAPVIVRVYGGLLQAEQLRFFGCTPWSIDNHHLLASRGYAVFLPDLPISGSDPADRIREGLDAAMQALMSQPEIDPARIGMIGHSFGGYTALVGVTRLQWFQAAVVSAGIANLISFAAHFDPLAPDGMFARVEGGQFALRETIWDNPNRYVANSPMFELDRTDAPILLLQGTRDPICASQAGPIYSALRRLGKTAELVLYNGEDHSPLYWKEENRKDYLQRVVEWFDRYL